MREVSQRATLGRPRRQQIEIGVARVDEIGVEAGVPDAAAQLPDVGRLVRIEEVAELVRALVGLGLTTGIVWAGDASGFDPRLAKLVAIAVSFTATWLLRSRVVFR